MMEKHAPVLVTGFTLCHAGYFGRQSELTYNHVLYSSLIDSNASSLVATGIFSRLPVPSHHNRDYPPRLAVQAFASGHPARFFVLSKLRHPIKNSGNIAFMLFTFGRVVAFLEK